jgi:hypothetical protein
MLRRYWQLFFTVACCCLLGAPRIAQTQDHHDHHSMRMDTGGMVMGENRDRLPHGCTAVSGDHVFTVRAGTRFAGSLPGAMFSFDQRDFQVPPCSRLTVNFHNEDEVRHQWMVHGLPRYLYPGGMFHLEANGGVEVSGTFIVPAEDATYLVHCDVAQHMEKGMKAQLKVGRGGGDLWAIPGTTGPLYRDEYLPSSAAWLLLPAGVTGWFLGWMVVRLGRGSEGKIKDK